MVNDATLKIFVKFRNFSQKFGTRIPQVIIFYFGTNSHFHDLFKMALYE